MNKPVLNLGRILGNALAADEPRIVAECWTCCPTVSGYEQRPVLGDPDAHRAAGHDVRPVEPQEETK